MGWHAEVVFLLLIRYTTTAPVFHNINLADNLVGEDIQQDLQLETQDSFIDQYEDLKLDHLRRLLTNLLLQPWPRGVSPILYAENIPLDYIQNEVTPETDNMETDASNVPSKRTRYYRKYPWKRQNSRYDAENRYLCQPSKEDVFRLLVALHEARQGNRGQMVNFCNRKRPASVIFTNIRFLG